MDQQLPNSEASPPRPHQPALGLKVPSASCLMLRLCSASLPISAPRPSENLSELPGLPTVPSWWVLRSYSAQGVNPDFER